MTTQVVSMLQNLMVFIPALLSSILIIVFFSKVNPVFALILAIWIAIHFSICIFFTSRCVKYSNEHGEARSVLAGKIVDSFTNNFAVNLFYRFQFELLTKEEIHSLASAFYKGFEKVAHEIPPEDILKFYKTYKKLGKLAKYVRYRDLKDPIESQVEKRVFEDAIDYFKATLLQAIVVKKLAE